MKITRIVQLVLCTVVVVGMVVSCIDNGALDGETARSLEIETQASAGASPVQTGVNIPVDGTQESPRTLNHFVSFPLDYDPSRPQGYPLLIFMHGLGERGDANGVDGAGNPTLDMEVLNRVLKKGPPHLIENGRWDDSLPFIVLSPQNRVDSWYGGLQSQIYQHAVQNYHVDTDRVYVTGLSQGGNGVWLWLKDHPEWIAAAIPVAAWGSGVDCAAVQHVAVWGFHGDADRRVTYNSGRSAVDALNACNPTHRARLTSYAGVAHNSWTRTYDNTMTSAYNHEDAADDGTGNLGGDGVYYQRDIYRWLLSFSLAGAPSNIAPVADGGGDRTLSLPTDSIDLVGSGTDSDGTVVAYQWSQLSGPAATMAGSDGAILSLSNLTAGTYRFRLTVTDDAGATGSDEVNVIVHDGSTPSAGGWLHYAVTGYGHSALHYHDGNNVSENRVDIVSLGHDAITVSMKAVSGNADLRNLIIGVTAGGQTREVTVGDYVGGLSATWTAFTVPLTDFAFSAGKLDQGIYNVKVRAKSGLGSVEFGVDEIYFVGGAAPFVYYGDDYELSGSGARMTFTTTYIDVIDRPTSGGAP